MVAVAAHRTWRRVRDKGFSLAASPSFAAFGRRSVIALPTRIDGERRIRVGNDVYVGPSSWLHAAEGGRITVGDGVSATGRLTLSAFGSITVEDGVLFAAGVYVADHGHRFGDADRPVQAQGVTEPEPVTIREHAWIGQNAVVLAGVTIGRGAVVGSNAVVTRDVPDGGVAVGVPARVREEER